MKSDERFILSPEEAQIVEDNMELVKWIVHHKTIWTSPDDFQEKVQIGAIGLIKAVKTFDKSKGLKFATYATTCILNEIMMDYRNNKKFLGNISFEQIVNRGEDGSELTIESCLSDEKTYGFEEKLEDKQELARMLSIILNYPLTRQKLVILLNSAGVKQRRSGNLIGISRSYICRLVSEFRESLLEQFSNQDQEPEYKEIYKVSIDEITIRVSFSISDIENFNQKLAEFLLNMEEEEQQIDFDIRRSRKQVTIYLPAEKEALGWLGMLIRVIESPT